MESYSLIPERSPDNPAPTLRLCGLSVCFASPENWVWANSDVDVEAYAGEILAIVGESGSGKTTVVNAIVGLLRGLPGGVSGSIELAGQSIWPDPSRYVKRANHTSTRISKDVLAWENAHQRLLRPVLGKQIGLVFQEPVYTLDPRMAIAEQFAEMLRRHDSPNAETTWDDDIREVLRSVDLDYDYVAGKIPSQLSGGECQRIAIAMAVFLRPCLLLCDEPTTAVDVEVRISLYSLVERYAHRDRNAVILISHHWPEVQRLADRIAVMSGGQMVEWLSKERMSTASKSDLHPVSVMWRDGDMTQADSGESEMGAPPDRRGCPIASTCAVASSRGPEFRRRCALHPVPAFRVRIDQVSRCWLFENVREEGCSPHD